MSNGTDVAIVERDVQDTAKRVDYLTPALEVVAQQFAGDNSYIFMTEVSMSAIATLQLRNMDGCIAIVFEG